jgi:hypothetical protein
MLAGIFTTLLIPETKRRTLKDLAQDWEANKAVRYCELARKSATYMLS